MSARPLILTELPARSVTRAAVDVTGDAEARPLRRAASAPVDPALLAHRIGRLAVLSLAVGVAVAILTTHDATWWQHHFSQLGTHTDFSGRTFNTIAIFSGFFLAAYGVFFAIALPAEIGRRASRGFRGSVISAGLHLTGVGMVPIPVSAVMHDLIATGLGLSFLATVATGLAIPGRSRRFRRATMFCVALLATGMVVLTAGFITLALFEFVAFVTMGIWLLSLPRVLACTPAPVPVLAAIRDAEQEAPPAAGERVSPQSPWPTPSPSRSNDSSTRPAASRRRAGCAPERTAPRSSRPSSAPARRARTRAATSGARRTASAASRPARDGRASRCGAGGSAAARPGRARSTSSGAPALRACCTLRPRHTSSRGIRNSRLHRPPERARSSARSPLAAARR